MAKVKKNETELQKLERIFAKAPENKRELCEKLINNAAFMAEQLTNLQDIIKRDGCVDQYKNGENQFGLKKSAALEAYNTIIKNYNSVIKQLLDILPDGAEADELESFLGGRK